MRILWTSNIFWAIEHKVYLEIKAMTTSTRGAQNLWLVVLCWITDDDQQDQVEGEKQND